MFRPDPGRSPQSVDRSVHPGAPLPQAKPQSLAETPADTIAPPAILPADWDLLLEAVETKLTELTATRTGPASAHQEAASEADATLAGVMECLDALRHLHALLPHDSLHLSRLMQATGQADAALTQTLARPWHSGPAVGLHVP